MKIAAALMFGLLGVTLCGPTVATPLPPSGTFIYSNACESDGGDFGNFRVTLTRDPRHIKVVIEFNDEGPDGHAQASNIRFDPVKESLHFSYLGSETSSHHTFIGTVSREKLQGQFDGDDTTLPAIKKIPKELPGC